MTAKPLVVLPLMLALCHATKSTANAAGGEAGGEAGGGPVAKTSFFSEIDRGEMKGWEARYEAKVEVTKEHAPQGQSALQLKLSPGSYPGLSYESKPMDWSQYEALRFTVFNEGNDLRLSYRVDEAATKDFATRFQSDLPLRLRQGGNELEISVAVLRQGNLFSRGLDVTKINALRFFVGGLKEPVTLYFSNFRFIAKTGGAHVRTFPRDVSLEPPEGTEAVQNAGSKDLDLNLRFTGGKYPGVTLSKFNGDFLGYDLLSFELASVENTPKPDNVSYKITDGSGRSMTFSTSLVENKGQVVMPVELAGHLSLGDIREFTVFFGDAKGQAVNLRNVKLTRLEHVDAVTVHGDPAANAMVTLDFKPLEALGKSTVFMGMLAVPLEDGKTRWVRCNSETKGITRYEVPAEAFAGAKNGGTIRVWGYLSEHGIWHFRETSVPVSTSPQVVKFEDAKLFNH
jgi:hypothetical protein